MKKYVFFMTGCKSWLRVAKKLKDKKIAQPVFWLGDERHKQEALNYFGDVVHSLDSLVHYPNELKNIDYKGEGVNFFRSQRYLEIKDKTIKMMDRVDSFGNFTLLDREVIFKKIAMWGLKHISISKPDVFISSDSPHSFAQYLIYEICNYYKIPSYKFNTYMPLPLLFLENIENGEKIYRTTNVGEQLRYNFKEKINKFVSKIENSFNKEEKYEHKFMKSQRMQSKFLPKISQFFQNEFRRTLSEIKKDLFSYRGKYHDHLNPFKLNFFTRLKMQQMKAKNLKKHCQLESEQLDGHNRYVYFALMHEPERTSNPDAGVFHDQLIAILSLRKILPSDILLVVKEHPTQFYLEERGAKGRSPLFYSALKNIDGVRFLGPFEDSNKLIKNAIFSTSLTGTVALESAIIGKPGLIFGKTWFKGCPNIFSFEEIKSIQELTHPKNLSSSKDIIHFLEKEYEMYCVPGCQNLSAEKRFVEYLDGEFKKDEENGIFNLMSECFKKDIQL